MNIHYDVTHLLSAVWKLAREEVGRIHIALILISRRLPVPDNLIDEDAIWLLGSIKCRPTAFEDWGMSVQK